MYITQYEHELGPPWKSQDLWIKLSYPFFHADRIKTPTLFMGGEKDFNVPLLGSEQMYQALRSLGVDTQLVIYPSQFHGITTPSYKKDRLERYLDWYEQVPEAGADDHDAGGGGSRAGASALPSRPRSRRSRPRRSRSDRSAAPARRAPGALRLPCCGCRSAGRPRRRRCARPRCVRRRGVAVVLSSVIGRARVVSVAYVTIIARIWNRHLPSSSRTRSPRGIPAGSFSASKRRDSRFVPCGCVHLSQRGGRRLLRGPPRAAVLRAA